MRRKYKDQINRLIANVDRLEIRISHLECPHSTTKFKTIYEHYSHRYTPEVMGYEVCANCNKVIRTFFNHLEYEKARLEAKKVCVAKTEKTIKKLEEIMEERKEK